MNDAQRQSLKNLIHAVERIRREAEGKYLPFELSAAIESADQARTEVYEIAYSASKAE